jgi:hypothetical protein
LSKDVEFRILANSASAKQSFDGINLTTAELEQRIRDLDAQLKEYSDLMGGKLPQQIIQVQRLEQERSAVLSKLIQLQDEATTSTARGARGMGSLAGQLFYATSGISGFNRTVSVLVSSLASGAGLTTGLALAVGGIIALSEVIKSSKNTMEDYQKAVKGVVDEMVKLNNPMAGTSYNINPQALDSLIAKVTQWIATLKAQAAAAGANYGLVGTGLQKYSQGVDLPMMLANMLGLTQSLNQTDKERLATNKVLLEKFQEMKAQLEAQKMIQEAMANLGVQSVNKYQHTVTGFSGLQGAGIGMQPGMTMPTAPSALSSLILPPDLMNTLNVTPEQIKKAFPQYWAFSQAAAKTFQDAFDSVWEDIFGHANNLLLDFIKNIASAFESLATEKLAGWLFSLIPGVGPAASAAVTGAGAEPWSFNINLGDQTVQRVVVSSMRQAQRLRL